MRVVVDVDSPVSRTVSSPRRGDPEWHRSATRWVQLALVEDDPLHVDLSFWEDVFARTKANAVCVSAGGYVAFYPTDIPDHHRSVYLGQRDLLGEIVDLARRRGMHVMARVDPHAVHPDTAAAHPEWLARLPDGSLHRHPSFNGAWITCPFSTYHSDFLPAVAEEIVQRYDVDAVFANRWAGHGISYSDAARDGFSRATGFDLPHGPTDPSWEPYQSWRRDRLSDLIRRWNTAVRSIRPHVRFIPSLGGAFPINYFDRDLIEAHYPFFALDKQSRRGDEPIWAAGLVPRRARAVFRDRRVMMLSNIGPEVAPRWKDAVLPGAELMPWIADGFVQGGVPWVVKFNGRVRDPRWVEPVADAFTMHALAESAYEATEPFADIVVYEPPRAIDGSLSTSEPFSHEFGVYQALVEAGMPFELVTDVTVSVEDLSGFRMVILPHADSLTAAAADVLRAFVKGGGSLLAFGGVTLDPTGAATGLGPAETIGDVLGVRAIAARGPLLNNYLEIDTSHPILSGFAPAERLAGGTSIVEVTVDPDATIPARFIPDYPEAPMEEVYPREAVGAPAIVLTERAGCGRTAYVAFDLGDVTWKYLLPDHRALIAALVSWVDPEPTARVHAAGPIDVAVRRGTDRLVVGMANLANANAMRGFHRALASSGMIDVRVRIPNGARGVQVTSPLSGTAYATGRDGDDVLVAVPPFDVLEVLDVRWKSTDGE